MFIGEPGDLCILWGTIYHKFIKPVGSVSLATNALSGYDIINMMDGIDHFVSDSLLARKCDMRIGRVVNTTCHKTGLTWSPREEWFGRGHAAVWRGEFALAVVIPIALRLIDDGVPTLHYTVRQAMWRRRSQAEKLDKQWDTKRNFRALVLLCGPLVVANITKTARDNNCKYDDKVAISYKPDLSKEREKWWRWQTKEEVTNHIKEYRKEEATTITELKKANLYVVHHVDSLLISKPGKAARYTDVGLLFIGQCDKCASSKKCTCTPNKILSISEAARNRIKGGHHSSEPIISSPNGITDVDLNVVIGGGWMRTSFHNDDAGGTVSYTAKYAEPAIDKDEPDNDRTTAWPYYLIPFHRESWGMTSINMLVGYYDDDIRLQNVSLANTKKRK